MKGSSLLESIEKGLQDFELDLEGHKWRDSIPSRPGWYFIKTNAPPEVFTKIGPPEGVNHYDLPKRIRSALALESLGVCIMPAEGGMYVVYSGETKNLKARAREHVYGHSKTGCLALGNYPLLKSYEWRFICSVCHIVQNPNDSKLVRILGEQLWRAKNGWPILCGK